MRSLVAPSVLALFLAGCGLEGTGEAVRAPVTRWEYMCIDAWGGVAHSANQLGKDGWEMAAAAGTSDNVMWCFKRPLSR